MTITITDLFTASSDTSNAFVSHTTVTASVGDTLCVMVSADNQGSGGASSISSVTDSAGNTYTMRRITNYDPGGASDGITLGIFTSTLTGALSSGTVTANFSPDTRRKVIGITKLQPSGGATIIIRETGTGATGNEGSVAPTITTGSLSTGDVILGATAWETLGSSGVPVYDTDTTRGTWTGNTYASVSSGGDRLAVLQRQYKTITSGGTQTWNTSVSSANPDYAHNYIVFYESAVEFDVAANAGSYSISGTAAGLLRELYTIGTEGTYDISGGSAALYTDITIAADVGTYEVLGADISFALSNRLNLDADSYLITGDDVTFVRTNSIAGDAGSYSVSGQDATIKTSYHFVSDAGAYVISGTDANLRSIGRLAAETASYAIVGQDVTFLGSNRIIVDAGSYEITGDDISFLQERIWSVEAGSYEISGTAAGLLTDSASVIYDVQDLYVRNFSKMPFWRAVRAKELLWPKWKF